MLCFWCVGVCVVLENYLTASPLGELFRALGLKVPLGFYVVKKVQSRSLYQPLWKAVWRFLRKLKIELPYDPAIPLLGIYPHKTLIPKDTCTPLFIAALFTIAKTGKQPKCPLMDE